jgi:hypothetical protein
VRELHAAVCAACARTPPMHREMQITPPDVQTAHDAALSLLISAREEGHVLPWLVPRRSNECNGQWHVCKVRAPKHTQLDRSSIRVEAD